MCMALNLPPFYHCEQGTKASGLAALLIMLHRLAYPDHWRDLVWLFGRVEPELSAIFNGNGWHKRFKHLLESLELIWLNPEQLIIAIHKKGEALYNCWDFMDGTVRPIARPTENQWIMFSSKRVHCIKFKFRYVVYFVYVRYMSLKCSKCFLPTCSLVTRNGLVPHVRLPWGETPWCVHVGCTETMKISATKWPAICHLRRPCIQSVKTYPCTISWSTVDQGTARF